MQRQAGVSGGGGQLVLASLIFAVLRRPARFRFQRVLTGRAEIMSGG